MNQLKPKDTQSEHRDIQDRMLEVLMTFSEELGFQTQADIGLFLYSYLDYCSTRQCDSDKHRDTLLKFEMTLDECVPETIRRGERQHMIIEFVRNEIRKRVTFLAGNGYEIL